MLSCVGNQVQVYARGDGTCLGHKGTIVTVLKWKMPGHSRLYMEQDATGFEYLAQRKSNIIMLITSDVSGAFFLFKTYLF